MPSEPPTDEGRDDESQPDPETSGNPFAQLFASLGLPAPKPGEPIELEALLGHLQQLFTRIGAPGAASVGLNWDFTKDTARKVVAALGPDPTPTPLQVREIADAASLADMWLDEATTLPAVPPPAAAWSRAEWVENTMPTWQTMVSPIVTRIADALGAVMAEHQPEDEQFAGLVSMLQPMLRSAASNMFGAQLGQALGRLGAEVVGATDIGLPLTGRAQVALLPTNLAAFCEGLDLPTADVRLYLVLREAARQRLFSDVGWLGPQLVALVEHYASEITIDSSALQDAFEAHDLENLDLGKLDQLGQDMAGRMFDPAKTPTQLEILGRLENLLALVEGWVDDVAGQATGKWMPSAGALAELVRRRRAAGGPAETTFAALVGLELRPRRLRDAANLWAAVRQARGIEGRDALWRHPDLVPGGADLDDPIGFASGERRGGEPDELDAEIAKLLGEAESGG